MRLSFEQYYAVLHDPEFMLKAALALLSDGGNPYYAWWAIKICIDHKKPFPEWVLAYLSDCADRMMSDKAKAGGKDLRKILPFILGFPNVIDPESRRGPGNLLDPDKEEPKDLGFFALRFAIHILSMPITEAMREACNEALPKKVADTVNEKTLRRWLMKAFYLEECPKSATEWKAKTCEFYQARWALLEAEWDRVSRDSGSR
jgi:hypothetical protein